VKDWVRLKLGFGSYYEGWGVVALLLEYIRVAFHNVAWPHYDCENCIGVIEYGCYCAYNGACAPGVGPMRRDLALRWAYRKIWGGDDK
jgi:hypothetical protein